MRATNRRTFRYTIRDYGDPDAGISPFDDVVKIIVESGAPGGEPDGEPDECFGAAMLDALREWYAGATVRWER